MLARVLASVAARAAAARRAPASGRRGEPTDARRGYADEMVALRDEIGEARLEDVPALVAQMERLQEVSADARRSADAPGRSRVALLRSPAAARAGRAAAATVERDVLIGRATFVDAAAPRQHRRLAARAREPALLPLRRGQRLRGALRRSRRRGRDRRAAHADHRGRRAAARRLSAGRLGARDRRGDAAGSAPTSRRTRSRAASRTPRARARARGVLGAAPAGRAGARPPPARDRGADRSAPVRPHHRARRRRRRHPGRRRQRQDHGRPAPPRLPRLHATRRVSRRARLAGRHARRGAGGVHRRGAAVAGRRRRARR